MLTPHRRIWASSTVLALLAFIQAPGMAAAQASSHHAACRDAGTAAEQAHGVPPGLLLAIGRVESGRRDSSTGRVAAWPWTLNARGAGQMFATAAEAQAATRAWQQAGTASIDVGCFQVNLLHHPAAFASLEEAFDPPANAAYAGRFLVSLRARTGSWEAAVAAYHSTTPELGMPYRDRVLASWAGAGTASLPALPAVVRPFTDRVLAWVAPPRTGLAQVWTPSRPNAAPSMITFLGTTPALRVASR